METEQGYKNLYFQIEPELYKEVKQYCIDHELTVKDFLTRLIKKSLKRIK